MILVGAGFFLIGQSIAQRGRGKLAELQLIKVLQIEGSLLKESKRPMKISVKTIKKTVYLKFGVW